MKLKFIILSIATISLLSGCSFFESKSNIPEDSDDQYTLNLDNALKEIELVEE